MLSHQYDLQKPLLCSANCYVSFIWIMYTEAMLDILYDIISKKVFDEQFEDMGHFILISDYIQ